MARPKIILTAQETKLLSTIPEAAKALKLYHGLDVGILDARQGRLQLGKLLVIVNAKIARKGKRGLFEKFLRTNKIDKSRAYRVMSIAAPDKFATNKKKPSVMLRMRVLSLLGDLKRAEGPKKVVVFDKLVSFVRKNWMQN